MKKTTLFMAFLAIMMLAGTVNAQHKKIIGIRAGVNIHNISGKDYNGAKLDFKMSPGLTAGIFADLPVSKAVYIQPGLSFTQKYAKTRDENWLTRGNNYVELPVNILYKAEFAEGIVFGGGGPFFALGVGGKNKEKDGTTYKVIFSNAVTQSEYDPQYVYARRPDAGINLTAGYESHGGLVLGINMAYGLLNKAPDAPWLGTKQYMRNSGFAFTLGYKF